LVCEKIIYKVYKRYLFYLKNVCAYDYDKLYYDNYTKKNHVRDNATLN